MGSGGNSGNVAYPLTSLSENPDGSLGVSMNTESPGWLGSTIAHESEVHIGQLTPVTNAFGSLDGARESNELAAYGYELKNANRFGLKQSEVARIQARYSDFAVDLRSIRMRKAESQW